MMSGAFDASIESEGSAHYLKLLICNSITAAVVTTVTYNLVEISDLDRMIKELQDTRWELQDKIKREQHGRT